MAYVQEQVVHSRVKIVHCMFNLINDGVLVQWLVSLFFFRK